MTHSNEKQSEGKRMISKIEETKQITIETPMITGKLELIVYTKDIPKLKKWLENIEDVYKISLNCSDELEEKIERIKKILIKKFSTHYCWDDKKEGLESCKIDNAVLIRFKELERVFK